jgi:hypothetical protein
MRLRFGWATFIVALALIAFGALIGQAAIVEVGDLVLMFALGNLLGVYGSGKD